MRIAIDAMGGDRAPGEIVAGACAAARDFGVEVILVGDETAIKKCFGASNKALNKASIDLPASLPAGVTIHHSSQVVDMDEAPMQAMKKKPDSSVAVATQLHAEGKADAVLSAGNTGAAATLAIFKLRRIAGIDRPGIASVFPTSKNPTVVLDVGANVDCRPRHLAEFAVMGAAYARTVKEIIPGIGSWIPKESCPQWVCFPSARKSPRATISRNRPSSCCTTTRPKANTSSSATLKVAISAGAPSMSWCATALWAMSS
jgi:glycerol-3-phosphate acyltransferase PlsX